MNLSETDLTDWGERLIRIAIVSDTHGFIEPAILDIVASCDAAIHAGDIGSASVLESMRTATGHVFAVLGNNDIHEKWSCHEHDVLDTLNLTHHVVLASGSVSIEHGHLVDDWHRYHELLRERYPNSRAIVYGHTHLRTIDCDHVPWVLNPGVAGRERTRGGASCLVLEAKGDDWSVTEHCI